MRSRYFGPKWRLFLLYWGRQDNFPGPISEIYINVNMFRIAII